MKILDAKYNNSFLMYSCFVSSQPLFLHRSHVGYFETTIPLNLNRHNVFELNYQVEAQTSFPSICEHIMNIEQESSSLYAYKHNIINVYPPKSEFKGKKKNEFKNFN